MKATILFAIIIAIISISTMFNLNNFSKEYNNFTLLIMIVAFGFAKILEDRKS